MLYLKLLLVQQLSVFLWAERHQFQLPSKLGPIKVKVQTHRQFYFYLSFVDLYQLITCLLFRIQIASTGRFNILMSFNCTMSCEDWTDILSLNKFFKLSCSSNFLCHWLQVSTFADMEGEETFDSSFLGHADEVVEERVADDDVIMIKGTKTTSAVGTLFKYKLITVWWLKVSHLIVLYYCIHVSVFLISANSCLYFTRFHWS